MKRFEVNSEAWWFILMIWTLFGWIPGIVSVERGQTFPLWAGLFWLTPAGLCLVGAIIIGLGCWLKSKDGWLIRRKR